MKSHKILVFFIIFLSACSHSNSQKNLEIGREAMGQRDYATAWKVLLPEAEAGNGVACLMVGNMYFHGQGVAEDKSKAVQWLEKSAKLGVRESQSWLADTYHKGDGVPKNEEKALYWLHEAVLQNAPDAIENQKYLKIYGKWFEDVMIENSQKSQGK